MMYENDPLINEGSYHNDEYYNRYLDEIPA